MRWTAKQLAEHKKKKARKAEQPSVYKNENGVDWFLVEHDGHMPCSASGSPRMRFKPGIYLDAIGTPEVFR